MILTDKQEQRNFLSECYQHIIRIYNTYLTNSEKKDADSDTAHPQRLLDSEEKLFKYFPKSIRFNGWLHNIKIGKLYLLVSIYNEAAKKFAADEFLDLTLLFSKIKSELDPPLLHEIKLNSDRLMKTHRSHFLRTRRLSFLVNFSHSQSEEFLKKYGFFELESELPLINAIKERDQNKVRALVSPHTVNQKDTSHYGDKPLIVAAYCGDYVIISILIKHGAVIDVNALNAAIVAGNLMIVRQFLRNGADVNQSNGLGITPLRNAVLCVFSSPIQGPINYSYGVRIDIINELLRWKINWDKHTLQDETIFEYAEATKKRFVNNYPDHPNRAGFEAVCEVICAAQESTSYELNLG